MNLNRRNTLWLGALSVLTALVLVSGNVSPGVQALIFGGFVVAVIGSVIDFSQSRRANLVKTIRSPLTRNRMSPTAREAVARASNRPGYYDTDLNIIDVGLIASQTGREGMAMRRTRSISKDDDGVRPFLTFNVPPDQAERNAQIRFEIIDQNGREQYIYEMTVFLRDGEMNVLADNHLPLMNNEQIAGVGDWDLRIYVDQSLVGIHNFALTASYEERRGRLAADRNEYYVTNSADDGGAVSLEDLLRNQQSNRN